MVKKDAGQRIRKRKPLSIADVVIYGVFIVLAAVTLIPFMNIVAISLSDYGAVVTNKAMIFPEGLNFDAYYIIGDPAVLKSFLLTIMIVVASTVLHLLVCLLTAYPLSKKDLPGRNIMLMFLLITMLFGGGLIPYYLVIKDLGLIDNVLVHIVPGLVSGFNIILMKNFIQQIPSSLIEAARIDGAGFFRVLFQIIAPLSKPILATLALFFGVGKWNEWYTTVLFINDPDLYPIQNILRQMVVEGNMDTVGSGIVSRPEFTLSISIKMAVIVIATVPIMLVYPFLQKHFVKGIFMGSVKS